MNNEKIKCKICGIECKTIGGLQSHVSQKHKLKSKEYYDKYLKQEGEGVCPICGKETKYSNMLLGYNKYCCRDCADKDPQKHKKAQATMQERYGDDYKQEIYVNRPRQTKKERYGDENYNNIQQTKQTLKECFGIENVFQLKEVKEKSWQTKCKNRPKDPTNREKAKQTTIKNFGAIGFASEEINNKIKQTNKDLYDVENAMQNSEIAEKVSEKQKLNAPERMKKTKKTNLEKYGYENVRQVKEIDDKIKQTCLDKYNTEYIFQAEEVKEKIKETNQKNYNVDWAITSPEIQQKAFETRKTNGNQSKDEIYFKKLCNKFNLNFIEQYWSDDYPFPCDFYIPEKKLFIEINDHWTHGNHWFNENNKEDLNNLNNWRNKNSKYYDIAIDTWTKRDVYKRNIAKENNLNYIVFWNIKDIDKWFSLDMPIGKDWLYEYSWLN